MHMSHERSLVFGTLFVLVLSSNVGQAELLPIFDWVMSFFGSYEGPPFTSIQNLTDNIEERRYPAKKWVCTEALLNPKDKDAKRADMFMRLYRYIQGENEEDLKIEMTVPVILKVDHRNGDLFSYEMCFFIPQELQRIPPQPTNIKVRIVSFPELHVYSQRYGGYSTLDLEQEQMLNLTGTLRNMNLAYYEEREGPRAVHFISGYDSPTKFWSRRNEVWIFGSDNQKLPINHVANDL